MISKEAYEYAKAEARKNPEHAKDMAEEELKAERPNGITLEEYKEALEMLKNPDIFKKITEDEFNKRIVGEFKSRKAVFLSLCSIWIEGLSIPLNTIVSSESSSGKSYLCKQIINLFPKELVQYRTKITPEAFTYWHSEEGWTWDGKICYLEDISQALLESPTFKVMGSEGSVSTIIRKQKAYDIEIKGKPVILITTAQTNPNAEILNRFQIISLDESSKQTENIIFKQARAVENEDYDKYDPVFINSLRSLKRRKVIIPYAESIARVLKENSGFDSIRLRRDFPRLLALIKCSAVLHQYQREIKNGCIFATPQDYEIARECINYIQTQTSKGLTHKLKKAYECCKELGEFTAKDIYSKFPFVNQKMWYIYLDQLLERKMLIPELRRIEEIKQRVTYYHVTERVNFELPEFELLPQNNTNVTNITKDTIDTKVTND